MSQVGEWVALQLVDVVTAPLETPRVRSFSRRASIGPLRMAAWAAGEALGDRLQNGHAEHRGRGHAFECRGVRAHRLNLLPRWEGGSDELRQQANGAALRDNGGVHGQPERQQLEHERARERQAVKPDKPLGGAHLEAALRKEGKVEAHMERCHDHVHVHLLLGEAHHVSDVLAPDVRLVEPHVQGLNLLFLPLLTVEHEILAVVTEHSGRRDTGGAHGGSCCLPQHHGFLSSEAKLPAAIKGCSACSTERLPALGRRPAPRRCRSASAGRRGCAAPGRGRSGLKGGRA
mmetsp:Transcript_68007/g.172088  ORF Transcript_68007/g.172088 Transcript_68007/m.172088 type:complete len:289 (+) Transcript_68007:2451-3317(+)